MDHRVWSMEYRVEIMGYRGAWSIEYRVLGIEYGVGYREGMLDIVGHSAIACSFMGW